MQKPMKTNPLRFSRRLMPFIGGTIVVMACGFALAHWHIRQSPLERYLTTGVRRADLFPTLTASGRVESSKRTVIECQLENIAVGVRGQSLAGGGASVLLSVIPEGSLVKQGDVLAVLDSSDYEEMLRVQRITVERAAADHLQAELNVDIAKLALREFVEGTAQETIQDFEGNVLLARAELERATERLKWCRRMEDKGYLPAAVRSSESYRKEQVAQSLARQESAYALFKKFTMPKTKMVLKGAQSAAQSILDYQGLRLHRQRTRLALLEKQVENCTIRAPHDGYVIYANNSARQIVIEPGLPVRQRQPLFYLPDLNEMEVVTMLHESIVDKVAPEMRAHVQVEGIGNRRIEGHVTSVAPISTLNWFADVTYFEGIVKLEHVPGGLKPGMTAEVEIAMPRRMNVLAVPSEAILIENGHDVCVVVHDDSLERREVKLGNVTRDLAEVTEGLSEGEQVVLNPSPDDGDLENASARTELTSAESPLSNGRFSSVIAASH
jgi:HlyD family secretion protein